MPPLRMRFPTQLVLAGVLGVLASLLVACGSNDKLFPSGDASSLNSDLDSVAAAVASGDCRQAAQAVQRAQQHAQSLPATVDPRLRAKLNKGLLNLSNRAAVQCRESKTTTTKTATTPTTTTATTPTNTTPTQTTPTQTTPTQTVPTTPTNTTPTTPTNTAPSGGTNGPPGSGGGGGTGGVG